MTWILVKLMCKSIPGPVYSERHWGNNDRINHILNACISLWGKWANLSSPSWTAVREETDGSRNMSRSLANSCLLLCGWSVLQGHLNSLKMCTYGSWTLFKIKSCFDNRQGFYFVLRWNLFQYSLKQSGFIGQWKHFFCYEICVNYFLFGQQLFLYLCKIHWWVLHLCLRTQIGCSDTCVHSIQRRELRQSQNLCRVAW